MISQFKITGFLCCLFLCPLANASRQVAEEEKFDKLVKDYAFWKRNLAKQKQASKASYDYIKRLAQEKREALDRNPEVEAQYRNWGEINNIFIKRDKPYGEYRRALRTANKAIEEMIEALNEIGKWEVRYMGVLHKKKDLLNSVR